MATLRGHLYRQRHRVLAFAVGIAWLPLLASGALAQPTPPGGKNKFRLTSFSFAPSGLSAGAHSDWVTSLDFAHNAVTGRTVNDVRSVVVELPAGFTGNNTAMGTCTDEQILHDNRQYGTSCPASSVVGLINFTAQVASPLPARFSLPIYNMQTTTRGIVAELAFNVLGSAVQRMTIKVRPDDEGIAVEVPTIQNLGEAHEISVIIWGVPASEAHDRERQLVCEGECVDTHGGTLPAGIPARPFLSNPTSCEKFTASIRADSWEEPEQWSEASSQGGPIVECDRVPFEAEIQAQPSTRAAESPSGLGLSLVVPQRWEEPFTLSTSHLKDARVALPVGYTVNPSAGSGLAGCTAAELGRESVTSPPGEGCPQESKLGTVKIETPVLAESIEGIVYLAKPYENPFGSLLALYVVAKDPVHGILVKLAGQVRPDPVTGQLVTTFLNNPQVPFHKFGFRFREGVTAPLASPPACGQYTAFAELSPWSAPEEPRLASSSFDIETGVGGGACPSGGEPPFEPNVIAGTIDNAAGHYSPFYLRITRQDGEREITRFSTVLPPGLTANLVGVPFCPEAAIQAASSASGSEEIASPSCPRGSEIGHSLTGAGVGSVLAWTPGQVYLAGPYHGAPFSIVSVTSATVGPFDLGTVVIRFALRINPITAQAEIDASASDPIPHILQGIVAHVRDIHVYIDRPNFMLNPTNCTPMSITNAIGGTGRDPSNPADQTLVSRNMHFQAADCRTLGFKPRFTVFTNGRTSRSKGASLRAVLAYPKAPQGAQANIRFVKVSLPRQLPSRLTTLQKACPDTIFNVNPSVCPAASRVGTATARTPILPVPLTGPVYFVGHGGARFPELVIVLQGYGITIDLHGETYIDKRGITTSTFRTVPDEPVVTFELTLPQGPNSALAATGNLCAKRLRMPTTITSQNGVTIHQNTPITATNCPRRHKPHRRQKAKAKG